MTDFLTPYGFVSAVAEIKTSPRPMTLYFNPKAYSCRVSSHRLRPRAGIRVGTYDALTPDLAQVMRLELGIAIERAQVSRGTSQLREKSLAYYKAESGRRA